MAFAVVCDARKGATRGVQQLVLCDQKICPGIFWTSDDSRKVMRFRNRSVAEDTCRRFKHNKCQVVSYEEALSILARQSDAIRSYNERMGGLEHTSEANDDEFNR